MDTSEVQLEEFLSKYDPAIAALARAARARLTRRFPGAHQLIYDNYNALAIGFGPGERATDAVVSIALYPRWVSLFFLKGVELIDECRILKGSGTRVRHVVLASDADLTTPCIKELLDQVAALQPEMRRKGKPGPVLVKSISAKQRPRRPASTRSKNGDQE